jgi:hypothetical protein
MVRMHVLGRCAVAAFAAVAALGLMQPGPVSASSAGGTVVVSHGKQVRVHTHGRHGVVPMLGRSRARIAAPLAGGPLAYGGGIDGIGVTTGAPQVFLVFWGSQWGSASTDARGDVNLSGDPNSAAPLLQEFFKGLGTGGETWGGVMTQYCEGVATGSTSCPSGAPHVGYPTGGSLTGVWVDNGQAEPYQATQAQIAAEAVTAAQHFGLTSPSALRNAEIDVLSATGTNPTDFLNQGFCAFHDFTTSQFGDIAYTNMPYVTDAGAGCGQNFVNGGSAGTDDGFTIVNGHEYAETITDQNPAGGWTDASGSENGDLCAWRSSGAGATQNVTFTTGTFAVQGTWSNRANDCSISEPVV